MCVFTLYFSKTHHMGSVFKDALESELVRYEKVKITVGYICEALAGFPTLV